jgi:quinol monooxygenase YgiN
MAQIELNIVAEFKAKNGMQDRVRQSLERMIEPTLNEDANLGYALHQGTEDPSIFVLYEGWKSEDGFQLHTQQPHFKQLVEELKDTLDRPLQIYKLRQIGGAVPVPTLETP